jgi:para-aminobenzoate synthetase / 4-amino-4-deoxychorismate lyase
MNQVLIHDPEAGQWLHFVRPHHILKATLLSDVMPMLTEAQKLVHREGLYAAGWISYEASPAFDSAF